MYVTGRNDIIVEWETVLAVVVLELFHERSLSNFLCLFMSPFVYIGASVR